MSDRLLLAAAALCGLTAFAPAPFPKKDSRKSNVLSMESLQGTWVVQKVETSSKGSYQPSSDNLAEVRIQGARWTFVTGRGGPLRVGRNIGLKVDATKSPAWFDLGEGNTAQTTGIIRLRGNELQVLYQWGRPRPQSMESPPDGYWFITFRRK